MNWDWDTEFMTTFALEMKRKKYSPLYTARKVVEILCHIRDDAKEEIIGEQ